MSFCPTLTAWKFIPKMAGTGARFMPLCVLPLISFRIALNLKAVVALDVLEAVRPGISMPTPPSDPGADCSPARWAGSPESN